MREILLIVNLGKQRVEISITSYQSQITQLHSVAGFSCHFSFFKEEEININLTVCIKINFNDIFVYGKLMKFC